MRATRSTPDNPSGRLRSLRSRGVLGIAAAAAFTACGSEVADAPPGPRDAGQESAAGNGGSGGSTGGSAGAAASSGTSGAAGSTGGSGAGGSGAGGSGGTGVDGSAGAGGCDAPGIVLCDGFEEAAVGGPPSTARFTVALQNPQESLVVDDTRAARGTRSVRIRTGNGYERAVLITSSGFPFPDNHFFARALVYTTTVPANAHFTLLTGVGKLAGASSDTFVRLGGQFGILMANYFGYNAADQPQYSSSTPGNYGDGVAMPKDRWACLEVEFAGTDHELRVWLDDEEITRLHVENWAPAPPNAAWSPSYERVEIGFEAYGGQGDIDIWYDEIAIGSARIGCPK
jgi:hypothetical protein